MSKCRLKTRGLAILLGLFLASAAWSGNRLDMFAVNLGDLNNPFDDLDVVVHPFINSDDQPWRMYLYVDSSFNAIDPAVNFYALPTWDVMRGLNNATEAWNDVRISSFDFGSVIPIDHTFPLFPNQLLTPGATGLDGWNLITFQDPIYTPGTAVVSEGISWKFWQNFELRSFISLPGIIFIDPPGTNPPGGGPPTMAQIDFDLDGIPDVILEARDYTAGEIIETDLWLSSVDAWRQWPDDPNDLPTTPGGVVTRPQTLGTLDVQGTGTHELGHLMGIAHSNLERATMYFALKGSYVQGFRYPTDIWDQRSVDVDDEVAAGLIYPGHDSSRGTITGRILDGRNFDGLSDVTSGVIDPVLYATFYVTRPMTTGTIPAYVPDKQLYTSAPGVTQVDLDTSPVFWLEIVAEVQSGENIQIAQFPNPLSLTHPVSTFQNIRMHIEASPQFIIPGLPPFDYYVLWLDNAGVYRNDSAGVATDNLNAAWNFFDGFQPIPTEFYGGSVDPAVRRIMGVDAPEPLSIVTTFPLVMKGDDATSYVFVPVRAGEITFGIDVYTNTGGLPPGVTPTPIPGITPTPPPPGTTRFSPDAAMDHLLPQGIEWSVAAAKGDIDRDGDIDLYICNAGASEGGGSAAQMINRLYVNTLYEPGANPPATRFPGRRASDGNPVFEDRTFGPDGIAGTIDDRLPLHLDSTFHAKMADFNLDGYPDVFVSNSAALNFPDGYQNRIYINRGGVNPAQAGWFDDWTERPRTDPAIGIPLSFTTSTLPQFFNLPPFAPVVLPDSRPICTKCDVGDIDADGDIDIVVTTANTYFFTTPVVLWDVSVTAYYQVHLFINHTNDFDPTTRGFYFTDETVGLDNRPGEFPFGAARSNREAADRLPPLYPFVDPHTPSFGVILAPLMGDNSLDLVMLREKPNVSPSNPWQQQDYFYENADVDGDGVCDGYFRFVNWDTDHYDLTGTVPPRPFGIQTWTGLGGIGQCNRDNPHISGYRDVFAVPDESRSSRGVVVADFDYHGFPQVLVFNSTVKAELYVVQTNNWDGVLRGVRGSFAGYGIEYGAELDWQDGRPPRQPITPPRPLTSPVGGDGAWLARDGAAEDFDHDGDYDLYVAYSKDRPENVIPHFGAPNEFYQNIGYQTTGAAGQFTNITAQATSTTARWTYGVLALDFDVDGDLDIFQANTGSQNALMLNQMYLTSDTTRSGIDRLFTSSIDNPAFYDASPKFLPPYFSVLAAPPYAYDVSKATITAAAGDLTGDGLPDLIYANGALFSISGSASDFLINHGEPMNQGQRVFTPVQASWPGPVIRSNTSTYWINHYQPAYHALMADFDLDGDFDVLETTLGNGPLVYSNEDSADLAAFFGTPERGFNSIPDADFLGDGILWPGGTAPSILSLPALIDPGPVTPGALQKKRQNRRAAIADLDHNGTLDIVIGNGLPLLRTPGMPMPPGGAPNVLLLNGIGGNPVGVFTDRTETNLTTRTVTYDPGTGPVSYQEGINDDTIDVAVADFDGDAMPEIIFLNVATLLSSTTRYLDNNGSGVFFDTRFSTSPNSTMYLPGLQDRFPTRILVADFDRKGDATEDLNGNGVLDPGEDANHDGILNWWDTTETEDINGNGVLDPGEDGLAPFAPPNGVINADDLNRDGVITPRRPGVFDASWDVMITFTDGPPMLFLNTLPAPAGTPFGFVDVSLSNMPQLFASVYGADIGDVDLDGDVDVVVAISAQFQLPHAILFLNDGRARFTVAQNEIPPNSALFPPPGTTDSFHEKARDVKLFDVDMDGDLDMLLSYSGLEHPLSGGALNAFYVNRLVPENFNTLNRFRTYVSPYLIRLSPGAGYQGTWVTVNIVGQNLESGIRSLVFGPNIAAYNIARVGPNSYTTKIQIARNAAGGCRNVTATLYDGKQCVLRNAFTVLTRPATARSSWQHYR